VVVVVKLHSVEINHLVVGLANRVEGLANHLEGLVNRLEGLAVVVWAVLED
jgi:hypothetical protein